MCISFFVTQVWPPCWMSSRGAVAHCVALCCVMASLLLWVSAAGEGSCAGSTYEWLAAPHDAEHLLPLRMTLVLVAQQLWPSLFLCCGAAYSLCVSVIGGDALQDGWCCLVGYDATYMYFYVTSGPQGLRLWLVQWLMGCPHCRALPGCCGRAF